MINPSQDTSSSGLSSSAPSISGTSPSGLPGSGLGGSDTRSTNEMISDAEARTKSMIDRMAAGAHSAVDRLADRARPAVEKLRHGVSSASDTMQVRAKELGAKQEVLVEKSRGYVREHPLATVGMIAVAGMILGRMMGGSRERKHY